jgi:hypothetical protein
LSIRMEFGSCFGILAIVARGRQSVQGRNVPLNDVNL